MNRILFFLFILIFHKSNASNDLRIFQIYTDGGLTSAAYNQDYVILFNNSASNVSLNDWSLQYNTGGSTSSSWDKFNLTGLTIAAKGFILVAVQVNNNVTGVGANGANLPTPKVVWPHFSNTGLSSTAGKIALMNNQTTVNTQTPTAGNLVDLVGYGTANAFESAAATTSTAANAIVRINNGQDTDNNSVDFQRTTAFAEGHRIATSNSFPVKLIQFIGFPEKGKSKLNWQTTSEYAFSHFEIQKSRDAKSFENIGKVIGNSTIADVSAYSFIDESPFEGLNYYRLRQVDIDGSFEFSKIIHVNIFLESGLSIYPNPTSEKLLLKNVSLEDIQSIKIFDFTGKLLKELQPNVLEIDISGLSPEVLIIEIKLSDKRTIMKRILKL